MSGSLKALFDIRDGNNGENFSGVANVVGTDKIVVSNPSITSEEAMSMPEEGVLTINGKTYEYSGFTYKKDADGTITSYTFQLKQALNDQQIAKVDGKKAMIGESVDSMGIPYYMAQMNQFLRVFASKFNEIMQKGEDLNGKKADYYSFFTGTDAMSGEEYTFDGTDLSTGASVLGSNTDSYYKLTAGNVCINSLCVKDPTLLATTVDITGKGGVDAYDLIEQLALLKSDVVMYRGGNAEDFLKCMISDISIDTQAAEIFGKNYTNIQNAIDNQRMSISGVDEDEEALDLVKFQNAYNLSAKMISVMTEIYDRLILETGV